MKLFHFSRKSLKLRPQSYPQITSDKPRGLWVSVGGEYGWDSFCKDNDFRVSELKVRTEIVLKESAKILLLDTDRKIKAFTIAHGDTFNPLLKNKPYWHIKWPDIAKKYDGIIISPYSHNLRLYPLTSWYYGWDCASGCIWNLGAIDEVSFSGLRRRNRTLKVS